MEFQMKNISAISLIIFFGLSLNASAEPYQKKLRHPVCSNTKIHELTARLGEIVNGKFVPDDPKDVGSAIKYSNGVSGVSYDYIPAISARSRVGDHIRLCLVSEYVNCPPGDHRGKFYSALNRRTLEKWVLPNAEHICGGA
jgi:hypothetical protein